LKIFLDASVLSDNALTSLTEEVVKYFLKGDQFFVSSITHFEILWGYSIANQGPENYLSFLSEIPVEIAPMTKKDAEQAALMKPSNKQVLDALIGATVMKYRGTIWTLDKDFLQLLPKAKVRVIQSSNEKEDS